MVFATLGFCGPVGHSTWKRAKERPSNGDEFSYQHHLFSTVLSVPLSKKLRRKSKCCNDHEWLELLFAGNGGLCGPFVGVARRLRAAPLPQICSLVHVLCTRRFRLLCSKGCPPSATLRWRRTLGGNTEEVIKERKELRLDYPALLANIFDPRFRGRLVEHDEKKRSVCEVDRS